MIISFSFFLSDEEEGGIFYDAFEDTESMQDYQEPEVFSTSTDPTLIQYKDRLNKIHQKKANLRNKKVSFLYYNLPTFLRLVVVIIKNSDYSHLSFYIHNVSATVFSSLHLSFVKVISL